MPEAALLVHRWHTAAPHLHFLITSRKRLELSSETVIDVGWLEPEAAAEMLAAVCQSAGSSVPNDAAALLDQLQGWPIAILHAGSLLRTFSASAIPDTLLERNAPTLADLPAQQRSLNLMFQASWRALSVDAEPLLRALAAVPGTIRKVDVHTFQKSGTSAIHTLIQAGWVQKQGEDYGLHPMAREFVLGMPDPLGVVDAALDRLLEQLEYRISAASSDNSSLFDDARRIVALAHFAPKNPRVPDLLFSDVIRISLRELGLVDSWLRAVYTSVSDDDRILEAEARAAYQWASWEPQRSVPLVTKVISSFPTVRSPKSRRVILGCIGYALMLHDRSHGIVLSDPEEWLRKADAELGAATPENMKEGLLISMAQSQYAADTLSPDVFERAMQRASEFGSSPGTVARIRLDLSLLRGDQEEVERTWNQLWASVLSLPQSWARADALGQLFLASILMNNASLLRAAERDLPHHKVPTWFRAHLALHRAMAHAWFQTEQSRGAMEELEQHCTNLFFRERGLADWARGMALRHTPGVAFDLLESSVQRLGTIYTHFRALALLVMAQASAKEAPALLQRADALLKNAPPTHPIRQLRDTIG